MPSSRDMRLPKVERLAATGMSSASIAAQLGVHYSTINDDRSIILHRRGLRSDTADDIPPLQLPPSNTTLSGTWSSPAKCEPAWASTPNQPGVYRWFLGGELPEPFNWPAHLSPLGQGDLIYVGKASNLRTRAKHHKLPTAGSTLRRTLASLIGFPGVWQGRSAHPRIAAEHNALLTEWMTNNLLMSFRVISDHETLESAERVLRKESKAPMNKDSMTPEQRYTSEVGKLWKANAARP
jgi:hypothetical protein